MTSLPRIHVAGRDVGRIGFGAMRLTGHPYLWGEYADREGAISLLRHVVDAGVTLIDTADLYGPHTNETLIRDALHPYPADLLIATKGGLVRAGRDFSTIEAIGNPAYLRQCAYMSARRLGVDHIDLYYLHNPRARDASFEDQIGTLAELQRDGLISHIGLSNVSVEQFRAAAAIAEIAAVTAHYNLATRLNGPLMHAVTEAGVPFLPWQPISLSKPGDPTDMAGTGALNSALTELAISHEASPTHIALAWLLAQSPLIAPIPASTSVDHVDANIAAGDITLAADELDRLSATQLLTDLAKRTKPKVP